MVGALKRWLGIDVLERENLTLAKAVKALQERVIQCEGDCKSALEIVGDCQKLLTNKVPSRNIVPKPHKPSWRNFRVAMEKATEEEVNG